MTRVMVDRGMQFALTARRQLEAIQADESDDFDPIMEVSRLSQAVALLEDTLEELRLSLSNLQTVEPKFFNITDLRIHKLNWGYGYPSVLVVMFGIAALLLWNFYRRGWFDGTPLSKPECKAAEEDVLPARINNQRS